MIDPRSNLSANRSWRPSKSKLRLPIVVFALLQALTPADTAEAQNPEDRLGNWLIYNGTLRFTDDWSVFTESHLRLYEVAYNVDEWLVRAAAQYNFTPNVLVAVGYLYSQSYAFEGSDREQSENRLYEQLTLWQRRCDHPKALGATRLDDARAFLDIEGKQAELAELRSQASAPDLWDDQDRAKKFYTDVLGFELRADA